MTEESGIPLQKKRSIFGKQIEVNPKGLLMSLGKGAIQTAFLKFDDLAETGVEVLDNLGLKTSPGEIAGLLIVRSLMEAMKDLLQDNQDLLTEEVKKLKLKGLYEKLDEAIQEKEFTLDEDFFQHPENFPLLKEAETGFQQWLKDYIDTKNEPKENRGSKATNISENISRRLPSYFVFALNDEWQKRRDDYTVLQAELDTPFTKATRREQGWSRYRAWLQKRVEEPMFLEAFGLKQVYVPLRAYYEQENGDRVNRVVVDLQQELENWLQQSPKDDAIRLLSGGPGSGKSSFTKMLATHLAAQEIIPVVYIPLHLFKLSDDLGKAVGEFVQMEGFLTDNPLDQDNEDLRLLLIFDGLDELSMQGKVAAETAKEFVEEVQSAVTRFNYHQTRLQVLISGREVVIQANRGKFRKPRQLLYLLPYFVTQEEKKKEFYVDQNNLLNADQRQQWWQKYGAVKGNNYKGLPPELNIDNLVPITTQPLLNYLIAFTFERKQLTFTPDTNLNEIYNDLLDGVYQRGYENNRISPTVEGLDKQEFIDILEEIALACWHGDGRTTTVKEIEVHCEESGLKVILERFQENLQEDSRGCITRLLTAFYFRESGEFRASEKTFEFTHKSFGEYLTAKRIVQGIETMAAELATRKQDYRRGWDQRQALISWATLCGQSPLDEYLFRFLVDEISLQDKKTVGQWQEMLSRLLGFVVPQGMPMEGLTPRPSFQEELRQSRNGEEALLAVLNACARATQGVSTVQWQSPTAFGTWIARLQGQRNSWDNNILALDCLGYLNLEDRILIGRDFHGAKLDGANLDGANLIRANLDGANLIRANLDGAKLVRAKLVRAKLVGAKLVGANLVGAKLEEAVFDGANLDDANLEGANLEGANFVGANLEGAKLEGANLEGAILKWANLEGAKLEEAILKWANLEGANLKGANLEGANLERTNFKGAILEQAKLRGANLRGANLEGANVKGTILEKKP